MYDIESARYATNALERSYLMLETVNGADPCDGPLAKLNVHLNRRLHDYMVDSIEVILWWAAGEVLRTVNGKDGETFPRDLLNKARTLEWCKLILAQYRADANRDPRTMANCWSMVRDFYRENSELVNK